MISTQLVGRAGNQMFIVACVLALAKQYNIPFHIPANTLNNTEWPPVFGDTLTNPDFDNRLPTVLIRENAHTYEKIVYDKSWDDKNVIISGYRQSYLYFIDHLDYIRERFNIPYKRKYHWVGLHIRRGDYLLYPTKHPVVTLEYLRQAVNHFRRLGHTNFWVFTDDPIWAEENLTSAKFGHVKFVISKGRDAMLDFEMMQNCEHQITSNSSYSFWSATLNKNPDKIVVCPDESSWFGIDNAHLDVKDLLPPDWVRIKF